ncbi:Uncharacterised protein [Aerococcus viridans]|nr:Uncharacterised protein [Aerococcus viridans]
MTSYINAQTFSHMKYSQEKKGINVDIKGKGAT